MFFKKTLWFLPLALAACESANTPLDADTRQAIDSISALRIRQTRAEMDSLCNLNRPKILPRLVDSMRTVRKREIEEALKNVPKD